MFDRAGRDCVEPRLITNPTFLDVQGEVGKKKKSKDFKDVS